MYQGLIKRYEDYLPIRDQGNIVTLLEGNTPLIPCHNFTKKWQIDCELYVKFEGLNPTCSFKDRGMTYAVSQAKESGSQVLICASTGNTSASAAAYAARGGLKAVVLIPEGKIAFGKLAQAIQYGAQIIQIQGNFDQALELVKELGENYPAQIVNSINPYRIQGQRTAAFEVVDALHDSPDFHFLPVGNAGNITAYWQGYKIYNDDKKSERLPIMMGYQAAGAAPIVSGKAVENPETIATAIRIGNPASWEGAVTARDESGGVIDSVTDDEILTAYSSIANTEGVFCEPASAASLAGLIKWSRENPFTKGQKVVCTLTGHGLKDPDVAVSQAPKPVVCAAVLEDVAKAIQWN